MNEGKEDCWRYIVQCTKYQVPCIKYQVQCTMIPQKYYLGHNTNTYFVLRTWYLVQSSNFHFFILQSAFSVRHYPPRLTSSKQQEFVQGTKYKVPSILMCAVQQDSRGSRGPRIPTSYFNILHSIFDIKKSSKQLV